MASSRKWISARKALHVVAMLAGASAKAVLAWHGTALSRVCPPLLPLTCCWAVHYHSVSCSYTAPCRNYQENCCKISDSQMTVSSHLLLEVFQWSNYALCVAWAHMIFPLSNAIRAAQKQKKIYERNTSRINISDQMEDHDFELLLNYIKPPKLT